jgi:ribosomal 50S subunit-recycling heat shock protein
MRLDKYLKTARLIKRRTVANDACDAERVEVNGKPAKSSYRVKMGDVITVSFGTRRLNVRVLDISEHTTKENAALMYEEISE